MITLHTFNENVNVCTFQYHRHSKMGSLSIILKNSLPNLKKLYEVDKPLHAVTTIAIRHFIERFNKKPEWEEKVKFLSLNDDWRKTGTFAMVNNNDNHIFFNTLEPWPYKSLRRTLDLLNYDQPMVFIGFRDLFRPVVFDVIRVQYLEMTFDTGTKNVYKENQEVFNINAPKGYYLDSLNESHVETVNSNWIQRFSRSHDYIANCIAENPSTGMFTESGELVAWCIMLETGAAGNLYVDEKYREKGLGEIVTATQMNKVGKQLGYDTVGHVVHYNKISLSMAMNMGYEWIDNNSWIGVRPKPPPKLVPVWGI